jgi:TorA maturation chaperone TorD
MQQWLFFTQTALFLRFYARCFLYPYEEMGYELQHLFRELERGALSDEEYPHLEQVLNIINHYQGEEIKLLRENYVSLFTQWEGHQPDCPLLASEFMRGLGRSYSPDAFTDELLESGIPVDESDELDSIVNYLEYLSLISEGGPESVSANDIDEFLKVHFYSWIPVFCDVLDQVSQISFYKEVATGLKGLLVDLGSG